MIKSERWDYLRACIIWVLQKPSDGHNAMPFGNVEELQIQA
jgi:hypothetical protein